MKRLSGRPVIVPRASRSGVLAAAHPPVDAGPRPIMVAA